MAIDLDADELRAKKALKESRTFNEVFWKAEAKNLTQVL